MSILGEDVVAMAEAKALASANEKELTGIMKLWYIQRFIEGYIESFLESNVNLLRYFMKHFDKTYDEAASHISCSPDEIEFYRPLVQAYVCDQELYQTLLDEAIATLLCRESEEYQTTEI